MHSTIVTPASYRIHHSAPPQLIFLFPPQSFVIDITYISVFKLKFKLLSKSFISCLDRSLVMLMVGLVLIVNNK